MPTQSTQFTDLYAPGLRKVSFENFTYMPTEHDRIVNVGGSKKQFEEDYNMGGFGNVPIKPEGTNIIYDDPVPGSKITWTWTPRGKGFRVTHEAQVDELYGPMRRMAQSLGKAFRNQGEIIGIDPLNTAFTAAPATLAASGHIATESLCCSDAVGAGNASHLLLRGGTARNAPTAAVDLGVTALQNALTDYERQVDESGVPIVLIPRMLVVAPENAPLAREILGSQFKPYTSDNEINVIQDASLGLMVSHYLVDTDAWFILADKADHDIWLVWRERFMTDAADDFDSGDGKMKGYMRLGSGYGDWRGIWGSPGV